MSKNAAALGLMVLSVSLTFGVGAALAGLPSAQMVHCSHSASARALSGARRTAYVKTCLRGPLAATRPTAPTARSKEAQAITKPSGVDRTTRTQQCAAEADRKGLSDKGRSEFQLSCLATAGPVSEGETGVTAPHPANEIKGIGVNNYKPSNTTAASAPRP